MDESCFFFFFFEKKAKNRYLQDVWNVVKYKGKKCYFEGKVGSFAMLSITAKQAITMSGLGIMTIATIALSIVAYYYIYVLMPFFDTKRYIRNKIKGTTNVGKKRYYRKKYVYLILSIIPIFGSIFGFICRKILKSEYLD